MSDASHAAKSLRDRFGTTTEDRLGKALSELLENPLLTGAIGRAFDAREKAAQAQEVAMGALNIPSAADIERLTRRLRSVSLRLEGIEDGVERLDRALPGWQRPLGDRPTPVGDRGTAAACDRQARSRAPAAAAPKPKPAANRAAEARGQSQSGQSRARQSRKRKRESGAPQRKPRAGAGEA